jgi:hypothetical protein
MSDVTSALIGGGITAVVALSGTVASFVYGYGKLVGRFEGLMLGSTA